MTAAAGIELVARAELHRERSAIVARGREFTYADLLEASAAAASGLLDGVADLNESRVAFLTAPGFEYVATQWGIWRAGGVAVPLCVLHPEPELRYVIEDSEAAIVVAGTGLEEKLRPIVEATGRRFMGYAQAVAAGPAELPLVEGPRRAMMLYTSGTTSRPKGVVSTHANIRAQVTSLCEAWEWTREDRILNVLPLHHIHGVVNVLTCALWSGATCEMLPKFDAAAVWDRIGSGDLALFMAVPTVYAKLIAAWEAAPPERRQAMSAGAGAMRLMVSGSAALPTSTLEKWKEMTGHTLLERYGMTEIGMALSNPLRGERRPGCVGTPLPGVELRLCGEDGRQPPAGEPGEVQVWGPGVFLEYWRKPEATAGAFRDGWFLTGDVALTENGAYRLLGRSSVDIIKTGGYKVSALETEEILRAHPKIAECAVVGSPDAEWGERVCAAVILKGDSTLELDSLRAWCKERLAPYKAPTRMFVLNELPRNAMGKVLKPRVAELLKNAELVRHDAESRPPGNPRP